MKLFRYGAYFSFRHQIIFFFFLLVMSPFLFLGYYAYEKSVQTVEEMNSQTLQQSGTNLDQFLRLINSIQNEFMASDKLQNLLNEKPASGLDEVGIAHDLLRLVNSENAKSDIYRIRVYPLVPAEYPSYMSILNEYGVENEPWFARAKDEGKPFWHLFTPEDNSELFPAPTVSRIKRLYVYGEKVPRAVVAIDIVGFFGQYLKELQKSAGEQLILLDNQNVVMHHPDPGRIGTVFDPEELDAVAPGSSGSRTIEIDGVKTFVNYSTLHHSQWKYIDIVPRGELTKPIAELNRVTTVFLVFFLLLAVSVMIYITKRFTRPIEQLVQRMKTAERGNFAIERATAVRNDEIGWLYRGFERMIDRIQHLIQETERSAVEKRELEFQVLTHQINPHFLYNTLEAVRWKAEMYNASDISRTISSLGNLLRLSLNQGKELTTVRRELEHVKAYVDIEMSRKDWPIRIVYLVDNDIMEHAFLRLLLQPLVENAIKHAFPERHDGNKIMVKGYVDGSHLIFEVQDNGCGIPASVQKSILDGTDAGQRKDGIVGVGLSNVHQRLEIYFGPKYGLSIQSGQEGTTIKITHPII